MLSGVTVVTMDTQTVFRATVTSTARRKAFAR